MHSKRHYGKQWSKRATSFKTHCLITPQKVLSKSLFIGHPSIKWCIRLFAAVQPHSLIKRCPSPQGSLFTSSPEAICLIVVCPVSPPCLIPSFLSHNEVNIFITLRGMRYGCGVNISDWGIWKQYSLFESWLVVDGSGKKEEVEWKGGWGEEEGKD